MSLTSILICFINIAISFSLGENLMPITENLEMTFEQRHIHLGQVKKGDKIDSTFIFINTGTENIEIEMITSCECTTLDWTRKPILPGFKGQIHFVFDSTDKKESETIDIDINLKNLDPETGYPILETISYSFEILI